MNKLEEIVKGTTGDVRETLDQLVNSLADSIKEKRVLKQKVDYLAHDNRLLRKRLFGSSSEKCQSAPHQLDSDLFNEFELCADEVELEKPPAEPEGNKKASHKKPGRKPLPKHLPRTIIEHDLDDIHCECGDEMDYIGVQVSEQLNYQPAQLDVIEHHCKKYVCKTCRAANQKDPAIKAQFKTAKKPKELISRSIATPGLLAQIAISKFCDHLPLYRQETIFKRLSIELSRQTMSQWMLKVGNAVIPLVNLMQERILDYDITFCDETTLQVLNEPGRRAQTKSYMWCFIGGPPDQRIIIYQYHSSRKSDIPNEFFEGYQGALHCDGYAGYNALLSSDDIVGINCMAHVRRKFMEALPNGKEKGVSGYVVKTLRVLYKLETLLKDTHPDTIKEVRQEKAKPILEKLKIYLDEKTKVVPPQSKVGEAIKYTLKRWDYLVTYLKDGRYEIDNNRTERAIKPFVIGRKNWLFSNSVSGAHTSARLFSLIETAKANHIEPCDYFKYIFKELPNCTRVEDYEALLPWNLRSILPNIK